MQERDRLALEAMFKGLVSGQRRLERERKRKRDRMQDEHEIWLDSDEGSS